MVCRCFTVSIISIHVLREEDDITQAAKADLTIEFQSTSSARRTTLVLALNGL